MITDYVFGGTRIVFGSGVSGNLGVELGALDLRRPMVVTDRGIVDAGLLQATMKSLDDAGLDYRVFSDVSPNPRAEESLEAAKVALDMRADCFVALGGGSPIDAAKAAGAAATNDMDVLGLEGLDQSSERPLPVIAIPTTAGSGSEVTGWSVITSGDRKIGIGGRDLYPILTLADPALALSLPPEITAQGGMDVLTHAAEAYICRVGHVLSDWLALGAVKTTFEFLPRAVKTGDDLVARSRMLEASIMAGMAFASSGLGPVHAMAEAAGGLYDLPHGLLNAVFLPHVLRKYAKEVPNRMSALSRAAGCGSEDFPRCVQGLSLECGIDATIGRDISSSDLERMVEIALMAQGMGPSDLDSEEMRDIFARVFTGDRDS